MIYLVLNCLTIIGFLVVLDRRDRREREERQVLLDRIERPGTVVAPVNDEDGPQYATDEQLEREWLEANP